MKRLLFVKYLIERILSVLRRRPITVEYPYVAKSLPPLTRTRLRNHFPDCIGCLDCEKVCPVEAITIRAELLSEGGRPITSRGVPFDRNVESFVVDYTKCVMCGVCVGLCPTQSLHFDRTFTYPQSRSQDLKTDLVHLPRSMRRGEG